jgi:hypothetical protein
MLYEAVSPVIATNWSSVETIELPLLAAALCRVKSLNEAGPM